MNDTLGFLLILGIWLGLQYWLLPRMGVPT